MGFLTKLKIDIDSSEAFKEARKGYLLGSTMSTFFECFEQIKQIRLIYNGRVFVLALLAMGTGLCGHVLGCHYFAIHRSSLGHLR